MITQKTIIVLLVIFLVMTLVMVFLYLKQQLAGPLDNNYINNSIDSNNQGKLSPVQQKIRLIEDKTRQQVGQIVEQGKTTSGGITTEAGDQIIKAETQELMEKLKLRNPD